MAKTKFSGTKPDKPSTIITSTFMNSIFQTDGGHRHDGEDEDGHSSKILPSRDIDARTGNPRDGYVLTVQSNGTCNWEALPEVDIPEIPELPPVPVYSMPVFPQIESINGTLRSGISWSGTTLSVNHGTFTMLGTLRYSINPDLKKSFTLSASKIYHLRFSYNGYQNTQYWKSIAPSGTASESFYLGDLSDTSSTGYNRYNLNSYHAYFDSKYDDMLVATIVTNSSANVSDYIFYINKIDGFYKQIDLASVNLGQNGFYYYPRYDKFYAIARSFVANIDFWIEWRIKGAQYAYAHLRYYNPGNNIVTLLDNFGEGLVTQEGNISEQKTIGFTSSASGIFQIGRHSELDVFAVSYGQKIDQEYVINKGGIAITEVKHSQPFISAHYLYRDLYTGAYGLDPKRPWFEL